MNRIVHHFNNRSQFYRPATTLGRNGSTQPYVSLQSQSIQDISQFLDSRKPGMQLKEKENLYDENIQLKQITNQLREENQRLKINKCQLERELFRFEKLVEEHSKSHAPVQGDPVVMRSSQLERSGLVMKLKQKQKKLVEEIIEKTKQIDELKKSYRTTRIQELEIELQNAMEETIRLRQQLDNIERIIELKQPQQDGVSLEERFILQQKTLINLQNDNFDFQRTLKELEIANKQLKIKFNETDKSLFNSGKENQRCQAIIIQQLKEFKQLENKQSQQKDEAPSQQAKIQFMQQMNLQKVNYEEKIDLLNQEVAQVQDLLQLKIKKIDQLEQILKLPPPNSHSTEVAQIKPDSIQIGVDQYYTDEVLEKEEHEEVDQQPSQKIIKHRCPRVNFKDVQHIGDALRIMLHENKILYNDLDKYLDLDEQVTIADIKSVFRCEPFSITSQKDLMLLCRYLIEDNQDEFVIYDENRYNDLGIVRSIFKKLIGKYELFDSTEQRQIKIDIAKKLTGTLSDTIQMIQSKTKVSQGICDQSDFEAALKFHDIILSARQMEYLNIMIYEISKDSNIIMYPKLLQKLKNDTEKYEANVKA